MHGVTESSPRPQTAESNQKETTAFNLDRTLHDIAHWLPTQGPIKDFIHHNTLHAFQSRPFHDALAVASEVHGAKAYLSLSDFREMYRRGRITGTGLSRALESRGIAPKDRAEWERRLLDERIADEPPPPGFADAGIRSAWWRDRAVDLDSLVQPLLFRLLSGFLDQGISHWRMPHATDTFWNAIRRLVKESKLPILPLSDASCRGLLEKEPADAILFCLSKIVGKESHYERYLLEMLLAHPGWSGMVHMIAEKPGSLLARRKITIEQLVAVELLFELGWLTRKLGAGFTPLIRPDATETETPLPPARLTPVDSEAVRQKKMWQEAMEWSLYEDVLRGLESHHGGPRREPASAEVHAFFCIDDRECSLRRHLEEVNPKLRTHATAGFFGIDIVFQAAGDAYPTQLCPVVLTPKHLVREIHEQPSVPKRSFFRSLLHLDTSPNTLFRGWLLTQTLGLFTSLRLALQVFRPGIRLLAERGMTRIDRPTRLHLLRESDEQTDDGFWIGFSISEMVDRVGSVLRNAGFKFDSQTRLIVFFAHGASSANNPHFAAYDCGACSGRPGAPNARAIAWMANHPDVRDGLKGRGMTIPDGCHFVGALHDTTRDEITYFDVAAIPASHRPLFERFDSSMQEALRRNAKERCRRFEMVPQDLSVEQSLSHVKERASSIFEPRPEMNHATNALAIVGRRELTRGLFLDRRSFLNSYDPTNDPQGDTLAGILGAVVPVCGGINLEYYFSRVDNVVYGAGTKLPHNVFGLIGVANGVEGDLRNGLPSQMIEIHDPVRLLILVEQEPEVALRAVKKNPAVYEWVQNQWVHFSCISPSEGRTYWLNQGTFRPVFEKKQTASLPMVNGSLQVASGHRENIPVHVIDPVGPKGDE